MKNNSDEIICVYQDCLGCGERGKKLKKLIFDKKLKVRKVPCCSKEGRRIIAKAVFEHKIGRLPLFVKGDVYTLNLEDLIEE